MALCSVCSNLNARPRYTASGVLYGITCDGPCEVRAWDAHWQRVTNTTPRPVANPAWTQQPKETRKINPD